MAFESQAVFLLWQHLEAGALSSPQCGSSGGGGGGPAWHLPLLQSEFCTLHGSSGAAQQASPILIPHSGMHIPFELAWAPATQALPELQAGWLGAIPPHATQEAPLRFVHALHPPFAPPAHALCVFAPQGTHAPPMGIVPESHPPFGPVVQACSPYPPQLSHCPAD